MLKIFKYCFFVRQLMNQVPIEGIFRHLLEGPRHPAAPHTVLKVFAVCSTLLSVLKMGLRTYSSSRYKDLRRRLCRIIRHVIHHASDHWSTCLYSQPITDPIWARLQVEFDALFSRAVDSIVGAPKCWQFLAVIPYTAVSSDKLWSVCYELHTGRKYEGGKTTAEGWAALVRHHDTQGQFRDRMLKIKPSQAYYLLTTFANMATARPREERDFIEVVVRNVFELCVVCDRTRELCNKSGRDLLACIATKHPDIVMSALLQATQEHLSEVGVYCLYLFRALPLHLWQPEPDQLHTLLYWLVYCQPNSSENALTRIILSSMNWGFGPDQTSLMLQPQFHLQVGRLSFNYCFQIGSIFVY